MTNLAFLFPGQASQKVGMGREFHESFAMAREIFAQADEILGFKISRLCFEGPEEELKLTQNTQPALLTVSHIAFSLLGIDPLIAAGHSLGEYSALVASGSLRFEAALPLVHNRGRYMQEAVPLGVGAMAAILGAEYEEVEKGIRQVKEGVVEIANWNSLNQIVIAGHNQAVEEAVDLIDAPKATMLPVSAPFHCALMKGAEEKLAYDLDHVEFRDPRFPVITNVDAAVIQSGREARDALKRQVSRTVQWFRSMQILENEKIAATVELGSGRVLSGLMKRISRPWSSPPAITNIEDIPSLEQTRQSLKV